jgi:calpain-7
MKATKLASNDQEKAIFRAKCKQLLTRAEEIKRDQQWTPSIEDHLLKAPISQRAISNREELILLEGSKLNGFIFPPWTSEPDDSLFDDLLDSSSYT